MAKTPTHKTAGREAGGERSRGRAQEEMMLRPVEGPILPADGGWPSAQLDCRPQSLGVWLSGGGRRRAHHAPQLPFVLLGAPPHLPLSTPHPGLHPHSQGPISLHPIPS